MIRIARLTALSLVVLASITAAPATAAEGSGNENSAGRMMLVLDSSGSMKEKSAGGVTKIAAAKEALGTVIDGLPANQDVGLRVYGAKVFSRSDKGACTDSQRVVDPGTDNRDQLKTAIATYKPYGETPTGYALQQAAKDLGTEGQRAIVLVSDGESTCSPDPCKVAATLAESGIQLRIDVVGLNVTGKAREQLQCIAGSGNGSYYDAQDSADLASALDTLTTRAARPYESTGRRITGTQSVKSAPKITAGDWRDLLGGAGSEKRELFYKLDDFARDSTLHITASIMQPQGGNDAVRVDVIRGSEVAAEKPCAQGSGSDLGAAQVGLLTASVDWSANPDKPGCKPGGDFYLRVRRSMSADNWNRAGNNDLPVEIRIIEEPAIVPDQPLPNRADDTVFQLSGKATERTALVGGSSFANAPTITSGAYTDTLVPGETQIFLADVGWGQSLQAQLKLPTLTGALKETVNATGTNVSVEIYSPARALATDLIPDDSNGDITSDHAGIGNEYYPVARSMIQPVRYNNRKFLNGSFVENTTAASTAGKYAIVIHTDPDAATNVSYQVPVEFDVNVVGSVEGEPKYVSTPKPVGAAAKAERDAVPPNDEGGLSVLPIGLAVAGVAALAGAALLFRRSRSSVVG